MSRAKSNKATMLLLLEGARRLDDEVRQGAHSHATG